jgi:hypothetical protein
VFYALTKSSVKSRIMPRVSTITESFCVTFKSKKTT